ncbi:MAG TPA: FtsX-like permease family protein [Thermoanaerobaculia bacterium]|nr:FtsX-like permease family protein [Thermoanaerobaculia bacterium]
MLTRIALRNIFRNRRRSAITLAVIIFGAVGLILFGGYKAVTFRGLRESTIRRIGHLQVFRAGYSSAESQKPLEYGIENAAALRARIEKDPRVKTTAAQITLMGLISNGDKSETFVATAVEDHADAGTVLLGTGLARSMKVREGDSITLMTTTAAGSLNAMDLRVAGTFASGVRELDDRAVKMQLTAAQELLQSTKIEKLLVFLHDTSQTDAARAALASKEIELKSWSELASFYHQVVLLYNGIFSFLGLIVFGVVVFSVANTIVMSIFERTREIGTLMAIGTARARVWRMFFLEGLLTGVIGGVLGLAFGTGLAQLINNAKFMLPPPPGYTVGYQLMILLDPRVLAITFFISVFTATVSSIVPAFRASRMQIVDALGHI